MVGSRRVRNPRKLKIIKSAQIGQLLRLLKYRRECPLPPQDRSRRYLTTLIQLDLSAAKARELVPWMENGEFGKIVQDASSENRFWTPRDLGNLFEVTFEERVSTHLRIRNIQCYDRQPWEVSEFISKRRRERNTEARRVHRQKQKALKLKAAQAGASISLLSTCSDEAKIFCKWLAGRGASTITDALASALRENPIYKSPVGRQLCAASLRRKIARAANELLAKNLIMETRSKHERGFDIRVFMKRND